MHGWSHEFCIDHTHGDFYSLVLTAVTLLIELLLRVKKYVDLPCTWHKRVFSTSSMLTIRKQIATEHQYSEYLIFLVRNFRNK